MTFSKSGIQHFFFWPVKALYFFRLRCRYDSSGSQSIESDRESYDTTLKNTSPQDPLLIISKHLMDFDNKVSNNKFRTYNS